MGRFLKKQKRKQEQRFRGLAEFSKKKGDDAKSTVRHLTTAEILYERACIEDAYDNCMMMFDAALKRGFKFSFNMRKRLHYKMSRYILCLKSKYVTVEELEQIIQQETKMNMEIRHRPADPSWSTILKRQYQVVNEMTAVVLLALRDEFGWSKKRMERLFDMAADISQDLKNKRISYDNLRVEVAN